MKKAGFTIIELIIVIIIISILLSITPVYISNYQNSIELSNAGNKLASDLRKASQASGGDSTYSVSFDIVLNRYIINSKNSSETLYLPPNTKFTAAPLMIKFDRKGIPLSSGDTVVISDNRKNISVIIKKITGEIVVAE